MDNVASFNGKLKQSKNLFIPFIMAGDPSPEVTIELAVSLQEAGAHILELGVPYSDPLADGPVIQASAKRALQHNMTIRKAIELVPKMRQKGLTIPVVLFTYYNPVLQFGEQKLTQYMVENEVDGLLVPDLPFEESHSLKKACEEANLEYISLIAPNSKDRIKKVASNAKGFLYCVSSLGVTGTRTQLNNGLDQFLEDVMKFSTVPVAVGFGVSSSEQVKNIHGKADGVIIGSAIIKLIDQYGEELTNSVTRETALERFNAEMKNLIGNEVVHN
jgi:tryptophan synthase alpha chain